MKGDVCMKRIGRLVLLLLLCASCSLAFAEGREDDKAGNVSWAWIYSDAYQTVDREEFSFRDEAIERGPMDIIIRASTSKARATLNVYGAQRAVNVFQANAVPEDGMYILFDLEARYADDVMILKNRKLYTKSGELAAQLDEPFLVYASNPDAEQRELYIAIACKSAGIEARELMGMDKVIPVQGCNVAIRSTRLGTDKVVVEVSDGSEYVPYSYSLDGSYVTVRDQTRHVEFGSLEDEVYQMAMKYAKKYPIWCERLKNNGFRH